MYTRRDMAIPFASNIWTKLSNMTTTDAVNQRLIKMTSTLFQMSEKQRYKSKQKQTLTETQI